MLKNKNRIFAAMIVAATQIFSVGLAYADDTKAVEDINRISDNIFGLELAKKGQAKTINPDMPDEMTPQRYVVEIYRGIVDYDLHNNKEEIIDEAITAYCRKSLNPSFLCFLRLSP